MRHGFVRVGAGIPEVRVADPQFNVEEIEKLVLKAQAQGVEILVTPELSLTGYTCQDLFFQQTLIEEAEVALMKLMDFTRSIDMVIVVGMPVACPCGLLDCAVVLQKGKILGVVAKSYLSSYRNSSEKRWFSSVLDMECAKVWLCGELVEIVRNRIFNTPSCSFAIEVGQDLMAPAPPSVNLSLLGAEIILNLSADSIQAGKGAYVRNLISGQSARCICGYVYAGAGFGESSTDFVFGGQAMIYENGTALTENTTPGMEARMVFSEIDVEYIRNERRSNKLFCDAVRMLGNETCMHTDTDMMVRQDLELTRTFSPHPFIPESKEELTRRSEEIFRIQELGLAKRLKHTRCKTAVIGISGGLDSTLTLLVTVGTYDMMGMNRKDIIGVTMPGFGTTDRTYTNAMTLMKQLGITVREVSIRESCIQHFNDIGHDLTRHDVTYENAQARERTQILMDIANQVNGMVIGTGDLSELALGWATYNGDHMSMYCVNGSVPKTLIRHIVAWCAEVEKDDTTREILKDIIDTPISPELIPAGEDGEIKQKTEDLVGPYELHDFFLYYVLRHGFRPGKIFMLARNAFAGGAYQDETIKKWLTTFYRLLFTQQIKSSCLPDGPKAGSFGLSPRGDWQMPSDASAASWLKECENL
ncbi:MAG: NAD(+) synthase [Bacteroidaceae bacterium]|nr:NAD(+) synthase [Bacteroidaceae bacterium]